MRLLLLLCAGFAGLALIGGAADARRRPVTFSVQPTKSTFQVGEPVVLQLTLKNTGNQPVAVSDEIDGNFSVAGFRLTGSRARTRTAPVAYDEDLRFVLRQSLRLLAPGESVSLLWKSTGDETLGGEALHTVQVKREQTNAKLYGVGAPGRYTLSLVYRYKGEKARDEPVFTGSSNRASASFTIAP